MSDAAYENRTRLSRETTSYSKSVSDAKNARVENGSNNILHRQKDEWILLGYSM